MFKRFHLSNQLLLGLIVMEQLFLYYFFERGLLTQGKNAWGLFISSVLIGVVLILKFLDHPEIEVIPIRIKKQSFDLMFFFFLGGLVLLGYETKFVTSKMPIDPYWSDVIPMVKHQCMQFVAGLSPYSPVNYFGYAEYPNNLPMKWLPYVFAEKTGLDYRLFAYFVGAIVGLWIYVRSEASMDLVRKLVAGLLLLFSQYLLLSYNALIAGETIEILIGAYYMLLMVVVNEESGVMQGVIFSFCLMSRYSILLWLPLYAFVLYVSGAKKRLLVSVLSTVVMCALFLALFLGRDLKVIIDSYANYDIVANFEWGHHHNDANQPVQLFAGAGFAYYINTRFTHYTVAEQIVFLQRLQFIAVTLTMFMAGVWYWFNRHRIHANIFLMATFKIYLAVFLFFIKVPYMYLMSVGGFVSVALFCESLRYRPRQNLPSIRIGFS